MESFEEGCYFDSENEGYNQRDHGEDRKEKNAALDDPDIKTDLLFILLHGFYRNLFVNLFFRFGILLSIDFNSFVCQ